MMETTNKGLHGRLNKVKLIINNLQNKIAHHDEALKNFNNSFLALEANLTDNTTQLTKLYTLQESNFQADLKCSQQLDNIVAQLLLLQTSRSPSRHDYPMPNSHTSHNLLSPNQSGDNWNSNTHYKINDQYSHYNYPREIYTPNPFSEYNSPIQYRQRPSPASTSVQEEFDIQSMDSIDDTDVASDDTVQHKSSEQYLHSQDDDSYQDNFASTDPLFSISGIAARFNPFSRH